MFEAIEDGEKASEAFYEDWNRQVEAMVPKDKLLVFEVKDGWEPLCKFLDVPVPSDVPFPHSNGSSAMAHMFKRFEAFSRAVIIGLPLLVVLLAVWLMKML